MAGAASCLFCQIARSSTSTPLLHTDEEVVAFQDINPSAFKHYLVIPVEHISTVKDLQRRTEDYHLVSQMLNVGQNLSRRDAPGSTQYRFGFHQPPFNSVKSYPSSLFGTPLHTEVMEGILMVSFTISAARFKKTENFRVKQVLKVLLHRRLPNPMFIMEQTKLAITDEWDTGLVGCGDNRGEKAHLFENLLLDSLERRSRVIFPIELEKMPFFSEINL